VPSLVTAVCAAHREGDRDRVDESFALLLRLNEVLARHQNPRSVKAAMQHLGLLASGALRRPYLPLGPDARHEVADVVDEVTSAAAALAGR
jgi:dihydrodipicolinate synthase/N-acetylneuraminate lyase